MVNLEDLWRWLLEAGFRNYCFISYPHTGPRMTEFAEKIKEALEEELGNYVPEPRIYIDREIPPGTICGGS